MLPYDIENDTIVIPSPKPFPTTLVLTSVVIIAVIGLGILAYFKKRRS